VWSVWVRVLPRQSHDRAAIDMCPICLGAEFLVKGPFHFPLSFNVCVVPPWVERGDPLLLVLLCGLTFCSVLSGHSVLGAGAVKRPGWEHK